MRIGNLEVPGMLALAPMAGVTDLAFRTVCAELGADMTVTEMVSSRALVYQDKKSRGLLKKNEGSICGAQIFGNDPAIMAESAVMAAEISGCDFIDINMGCPMPKIANNGDGCGLMKSPELAGEIVKAVSDKLSIPVTVKCRLGWDKGSINVESFAQRMEDNGAAAITVHGRTRSMLYTGVADWDTIGKVRRLLSIPLIANGDIVSGPKAVECLRRTGADYLMVGRATFGDPWLFTEIQQALRGEEIAPRPSLNERMELGRKQVLLALEDKGEKIACLEARKHLAWYLRGVSHAAYYKKEICAINTIDEAMKIIDGIKKDLK
ncbi:MAG: tRNA dihydrouridine synthase DusB [Oscillospiraceae bacterium]|nr:tRNA dihydrouridine synthase DusB [Oscillospiraceae bacterium]